MCNFFCVLLFPARRNKSTLCVFTYVLLLMTIMMTKDDYDDNDYDYSNIFAF
jgi:hypothetical protein